MSENFIRQNITDCLSKYYILTNLHNVIVQRLPPY